MLREVAGINQVLHGTDFPYLRRDLAVGSRQRLLQSDALNDAERSAVLGWNALAEHGKIDHVRSEMESPIELVRRFCAAWSDNVGFAG